MTEEVWRPIPSCPSYEASPDGRIRSRKRRTPYLLSLYVAGSGYLSFANAQGGPHQQKSVHVAIAETFHGPRPPGMQVRHLNGNPLDNRVSNLAYGTPSENGKDVIRHGRHNKAHNTHCPAGHPFDEANTYWFRSRRQCRACNRKFARITKAKARARRTLENEVPE